MTDSGAAATPVLAFTRLVVVVGVALTTGSGVVLTLLPDRTEDYWSWTIRAPLSAAFLGASFAAAAVGLVLALREHEWQRVRIVLVSALALTSFSLIATLRHLDTLALEGPDALPRLAAWTWLFVYLALPPLVLSAIVLQERAGGSKEYVVAQPVQRMTRAVLLTLGIALAPLGAALLVEWSALLERWPWTLPALPASIVAAWIATYSVALLWLALREQDRTRMRIAFAPAMTFLTLQFVATLRFADELLGGPAAWIYVAVLVGILAAFAVIAWRESREGLTAPANVERA